MRARPDVGAIVHCHPTYATALSMLHKPIPAAHYMIAAVRRPDGALHRLMRPMAPRNWPNSAVAGLEGRNGVLLGNHGMIATGADLAEAMWRASELETLAQNVLSRAIGRRPVVLPDDEIMRIVERFKTYGREPEGEFKVRTTPKKIRVKKKPGTKAKSTAFKARVKKAGAKKAGAKKASAARLG